MLARTRGRRATRCSSRPLLGELTAETRNALLGRLNLEDFADGETVFEQGDAGDKLYIIKSGEVVVPAPTSTAARRRRRCRRGRQQRCATTSPHLEASDLERGAPPSRPAAAATRRRRRRGRAAEADGGALLYFDEVELDHQYRGQYFGERALLKREPRMAKVKAVGALQCYSLSKDDFDALDIKSSVPWERRWESEDTKDASQLTVVGAMGAGAFGTAWLVEYRRVGRVAGEAAAQYALKSLDKAAVQRAVDGGDARRRSSRRSRRTRASSLCTTRTRTRSTSSC